MPFKDGSKEYFEKLKITERFCGGDLDMARRILKGEYSDVIVVKGRFKDDDESFFGIFAVFIHLFSNTILLSYCAISHNASIYLHKPYDEWRVFVTHIEHEIEVAELDAEKTGTLHRVLARMNELKMFPSILQWIKDNDIRNLTENFVMILNNVLKTDNLKVILDFENTTSLVLNVERGVMPRD